MPLARFQLLVRPRLITLAPTATSSRAYAIKKPAKGKSAPTTEHPSRPQSDTTDAQPSGMDGVPGSERRADDSLAGADGSQSSLKAKAKSSETRETVKGPLADAGVETDEDLKKK